MSSRPAYASISAIRPLTTVNAMTLKSVPRRVMATPAPSLTMAGCTIRSGWAYRTALPHEPGGAQNAVPDELWREVTKHYDEQQVAALILTIATHNLFNRINVAVREDPQQPFWTR